MKILRATSRARSTRSNRDGAVLMLYALLVFALLGIAALCVDLGFASLSQAQMQTATDTASLEGLRLRDSYEYRAQGAPYVRPRVSDLVREVFDDDMHPTSGVDPTFGGQIASPEPSLPGAPLPPGAMGADDADALRLGAGPIYRVSGGLDEQHSSGVLAAPEGAAMSAAERWVDDPVLQLNRANNRHGDMLTGTYAPASAHTEDATYTRGDFAPAITTPNPTAGWQSIGFLVRMRRTSSTSALDQANGVSSRGAPLPLLFGMGALVQAGSAAYDPRRDGLTVRSTTIAVGRPPLSIGPPPLHDDGSPIPDRIGMPVRGVGYWYFPAGAAAPALRRHVAIAWDVQFWANAFGSSFVDHTKLPLDGQRLTVLATGAIRFEPANQIVGHVMISPCDVATASEGCPGTVGTTLGLAVGADLSQAPYFLTLAQIEDIVELAGAVSGPLNTSRCYMPLYTGITAPNGTTTNRVVAYGYGMLTGMATGEPKLAVTKGWSDGADEAAIGTLIPACWVLIAPDNTSSQLSSRAPALTSTEWSQVFDQNQQFVYPNGNSTYAWQNVRPGTVLTPVLAR